MTFSIIQKSQLEGDLRLDAEYYQPEYLAIKDALASCPTLDKVSKKITDFGAYSQMNFVEYVDHGVRFLRNQDISEVFVNDVDPIYIAEETYKKLSLKLEKNDIVTPRVGTIGNAAIILKENLPASANQNLAQIKPDIYKIDPLYLALFLCSRYGRSQFERAATGNVQPWLNLQQIKSVRVYVPSAKIQEDIKRSVLESLVGYENAISLYSQAEDLLLEELGLKNFAASDELCAVVNLSDVQTAGRMDAEYFQTKYEKLISKIKNKNAKLLGDLVSMAKGVEPGSEAYQDEGKLFFRVSNVSKQGFNHGNQKYISDALYHGFKEKFEPKTGEILLTKDATPGIAYVVKEEVEGVVSGGILRLRLKEDIDAEYLSLVMNSLVGQMQAERDAGGSVIKHWKPEQIKNLLIPILPKSTQQKIAELVHQSHEARNTAKRLLEEAKRKVEELIES